MKAINCILVVFILFIGLNESIGQGLISKAEDIFNVVEDMPIPWFYKTECIDEPTATKNACYEAKLSQYLIKQIKYPDKALTNKTQGTVIIQFVISKDGSIKNAEIVKDIGDGCGEAALNLVMKMPDWIPGRQRGIPVNVQYTLPVQFKLKR